MTRFHFGWSDSGLACRLYLPEEGARAAVLMAGSLGGEHSWSYRGLRAVAEELAAADVVVLWFDYSGQGQSTGDLESDDPLRVVADLHEAYAVLERTGLAPTGIVTFGVGAAIAGAAFARLRPLDFAVHWEPVTSGRRWLREQEALLRLTDENEQPRAPGPDESGHPVGRSERATEVPGLHLTAAQRSELLRVRLTDPAAVAARTLLVTPEDSPAAALACQPGVQRVDAPDTEVLLFHTAWPETSIRSIVPWVTGQVRDRPRTPVTAPSGLRAEVTCGGLVEEALSLGRDDLFTIMTRPEGGVTASPVLFVSTSIEPGIGVGRLWVQLARALAAGGRPCYRVDVSGFGDSAQRADEPRAQSYSPHAVDDVLNAAHAIGPAADVSVVGMCSGSYHALEAGTRERLRCVYALNPILDHSSPGVTGFQVAAARRSWLRRIEGTRSVEWLRRHLPPVGWRLLHVTGVQRAPTAGLGKVLVRGTRVRLFAGPVDGRRLSHRGGWLIDRYAKSGCLSMQLLSDLKHSVLGRGERDQAFTALLGAICADSSGRTTSTSDAA